MPAVYAHLRFGEEVVKSLPPIYSILAQKYPEAFALGTQGPDILFYHQPFKANELKSRGTRFHNVSGNEFFRPQAEKLLANGGEAVEEILEKNGAYAAYILGFLCHFTLDVQCHPYIDERTFEALSHSKLESELDKALLRQDGLPIRGYNTATPILDRNGVKEAVAKALDAPEENISLAIKTMRKINGLFSYSSEPFHFLAHLVLKIIKMDRQFGDMFLHKKDDPLCVETNQVLVELWKEGIPKAAKLIQDYFENLPSFAQSGTLQNELFRCDFGGIEK